MTRKKWALGVFLGLTSLSIAYLAAPSVVRWYVHKHHPDITIRGPITIGWRKVWLQDVLVGRPGLQAVLTTVQIDSDQNVLIQGGTVDITLGAEETLPTSSGGRGVASLRAEALAIQLKRDDIEASLTEASVTSDEICFEHGTVAHPKGTAEVLKGCVARDKSRASAESFSIPVRLPFRVPELEAEASYTLTIKGLTVAPSDERVLFTGLTFGPIDAGAGGVRNTGSAYVAYAEQVRVEHPWVAPTPVEYPSVSVELDEELLRGRSGLVFVSLGGADFVVDPFSWAVRGDQPCRDWFDALPRPLPEPMRGMADHFTGSLKFSVETRPEPKFAIEHSCKFKCSERPLALIVKGQQFSYSVYDKTNTLVDRKSGPGTPHWTPLLSMPTHVPEAFRLLEDPGFYTHRGVVPMAFTNSLKANLEKGDFLKGGSTITMQLAKNLWLRRDKTIGRKVQEALMTFALESCLTKDQIFEIYLNVIEFGPDIYGIGAAAGHYFQKHPSDLTPDEAFYLASILPAPRKALPPESGGLARAQRIMKGLARSGFISEGLAVDSAELNDDNPVSDWAP